jgi:hypothetical protein
MGSDSIETFIWWRPTSEVGLFNGNANGSSTSLSSCMWLADVGYMSAVGNMLPVVCHWVSTTRQERPGGRAAKTGCRGRASAPEGLVAC